MAAGLGFKTFAVGEVLTAADTNGYLMQGVLVFASAAARDAAITSPQEGQFAYLKDTNVTTYYTGSAWSNLDTTGMVNPMTTTGDTIYSSSGSTPARLGIGSTGNVLTVAGGVPTWAAPAAGGAIADYTLLNAGGTALTGATSITVSGISGIERLIVMVCDASSVNASAFIQLQINGDTNQNYIYTGGSGIGRTSYAANIFDGNTTGVVGPDTNFSLGRLSTNAGGAIQASVSINGGKGTGFKAVQILSGSFPSSGDGNRNESLMGIYEGTAVISSITIKSSSGNLDGGGYVYVFGSAN